MHTSTDGKEAAHRSLTRSLIGPLALTGILFIAFASLGLEYLSRQQLLERAEARGFELVETAARLINTLSNDEEVTRVLAAFNAGSDIKRVALIDEPALIRHVGTTLTPGEPNSILSQTLRTLANEVVARGQTQCALDPRALVADCLAPLKLHPNASRHPYLALWEQTDLHAIERTTQRLAWWQRITLTSLLMLLLGSLAWWVRARVASPIAHLKAASASADPVAAIALMASSAPSEWKSLAATLKETTCVRDASQRALLDRIERFDLAVDGAEQVIWDFNLVTDALYLSPRLAEILGVETSDLPTTAAEFNRWVATEDREGLAVAIREHFQARVPYRHEYRLLRTDGSQRWIVARGQAVWTDDGRARRMAGSLTDITQKKWAEIALGTLTTRYLSICRNLPGAIFEFVIPPQGQATLEVIGESQAEWFGIPPNAGPVDFAHILSRVHADDLNGLTASIDAAIANPNHWRHEFRLSLVRGGSVWVEAQSSPQRRAGGTLVFSGVMIDITARKLADKKLEDEHEILLAVLHKARGAVFRVLPNARWTILYIAGNTEEICGYPAHEFIGEGSRDFIALCNPTDLALADAQARAAIARGEPFDVQYRLRGGDGIERWVSVRGVAKPDAAGAIAYLDVMLFDVDDLKRAELTRQAKEERLALIVQGGDLGTWERNCASNQVTVNDQWCTLWGVSAGTRVVAFEDITSRIHADDLPSFRHALSTHIDFGTPFYRAEFRVQIKPDEWRWIGAHGCVVTRDAAGKPVTLAGTIIDITARKLAFQQMEESQLLLKTVIDVLPQRVFWKGKDGRYRGANRAFAQDFGLACVTGLTLHDLGMPPPVVSAYEASDQAVLTTGKEIVDVVISNSSVDGVPEWISYSKVPLRNAKGEVTGLVGSYLNVTQFKHAEFELVAARDAADAANRAKSDFLAIMSHEIRTPLNGVLGCAQLLQQTPLSEDQQPLVNTVLSCGNSLLILLNDILDLAKIESEDLTLEALPFDARVLCLESLELMSPRAIVKKLTLDLEWAPSAPTRVESDPLRVRQVLNNLVENALKFTEHGHVIIEVAAPTPGWLRFGVRDTGMGIPIAAQSRIFDKFVQADTSTTRCFGGTGLGLAICKRVVHALGGEIGVESTPGVGSTFWFTVPRGIKHAPRQPPVAEPRTHPLEVA